MADDKVLITESTLDNIADATREKNGESFLYYPSEIPAAIRRIPTGTGGGSVVAVFPILHDGEHIADIVVDGETFALYAPEPIEYTQGTGIEISQNGVVSVSEVLRQTIAGKVDNNTFATAINNLAASVAAKQDLLTEGDGISIHNNVISADVDVSDLSDVNLSSLADGQVLKWNATTHKWENADESGGSTVIANPTGTPTEELSTIQIGEDIYEIVGGGSSLPFDVVIDPNDNGINLVPNGGGGGGGSSYAESDKYSTTEKVIGEWINGKPLYQITIGDESAPVANGYSVSSLNIETLVDIEGITGNSPNGLSACTQIASQSQYGYIASNILSYEKSNETIVIIPYSGYAIYCVTLRYTKTTD